MCLPLKFDVIGKGRKRREGKEANFTSRHSSRHRYVDRSVAKQLMGIT